MASAQDKAFGDGRCPLCIAGTCLLTQPELLALMQSSDCCTQACQAALHSVVQLCISALSPVLPPLSEDRQVAEVIQVSLNIS